MSHEGDRSIVASKSRLASVEQGTADPSRVTAVPEAEPQLVPLPPEGDRLAWRSGLRSACLALAGVKTEGMERRKPRKDAHPVDLSPAERGHLEGLTSKGVISARTLTRARILLLLDEGWAPSDVPAAVGCGEATVRRVRARYEQEGLERALTEAPRPGHAKVLSDKQEAHIIAMVCSAPPDGHARWTIKLIVEQALLRGIVDKVGHETIRVLLCDHDLKPWREKNVVRAQARRRVHPEDGRRARGVRAAA